MPLGGNPAACYTLHQGESGCRTMRCLHTHGAMACWDWAVSRPHASCTGPRRFTDAHMRDAKANRFRLGQRRSDAPPLPVPRRPRSKRPLLFRRRT